MLWSATVTKKQPFLFDAPFDLRITSAVLGDFKRKGNDRIFLSVTHIDFVAEENRTSPLVVFSGSTEFVNLDMIVDEGEPVTFTTEHPDAVIHLNGYYLLENERDDDDDDDDVLENMRDSIFASSDEDEEFDPNDISMDSRDLSDDDSDEDSDDAPKVEVLEEDTLQSNILDRVKQKTAQLTKKRAQENPSVPDAKKVKTEQSPKQSTPKKQAETPKKETPKKQAETPKKTETPKGKPATPAKSPISPRQLKGGLKIDIIKPSANSMVAKKGSKVTVKYVGRLASNRKVFDQGKFTFSLGAGKVIKGWDQGLENMPVGETRKLVIPPQLAYGKSALDGIPANSTLEFEVTLMNVRG